MMRNNTNKGTLGSEIRRNLTSYIMLSPYMILFIVLTVIPVVAAIALSFTSFNMLEPPKFFQLNNYIRLFCDDEIFPTVLRNTLLFAIVTGPVGYILSFFTAWAVNELGPKLRTFFTFCFYSPALTGSLYVIWVFIFSGDEYGIANSLLQNIGLITKPIQWLSDTKWMMTSLIIVQLWSSFGIGFLTFVAGFQSQDKSLAEAGMIDGVKNRWQELWYITLPSMKPQLMFGAIMSITGAFGFGGIVDALAGFPSVNYCAHTIMHHLNDYGGMRYEIGYSSAIAVILFLMMIGANMLVKRLLSKIGT